MISKIIKRDGTEVDFDSEKIFNAISKANIEVDEGKLVWESPVCKNRDQNKLNVARRTCGYIGTNFWNQGRTQEISERVLYL